jgi:predicted nucleic acid-binding protein
MRYLDTSALLKLATVEPETPALRAYLTACGEPECFASMLAQAELLRAARPAGAGAIAAARRVLSAVHLVDVTREILERAGTLRVPQRLRTLDAIHLATARAEGTT